MKAIKKYENLFYMFVGTVLEHLDGMLFALYLPILAMHFFSPQSSSTTWLLGFLSFSLYFVIRPLGAICLGIIGDIYGRKRALLLSIAMMSLATLGLGVIPYHSAIGAFASVIFLALRMLQGFSVGGEYSTAMTYLFETASAKRRTFYGALLISATHVGGSIAAIFAYLNPSHFRPIFIVAGLIGLFSLRGRVLLTETYVPKKNTRFSIKNYFRAGTLRSYLRIIMISSCLIFIFYTVIVYFNKIINQSFDKSLQTAFSIDLVLLLTWTIFTPIVGYITDYFSIPFLRVMRLGNIGTAIIGIPILLIAHAYNKFSLFIIAQFVITLFHIMFCAPTPRMICNFFKIHVRNAHVSFSYAIGISITAASMPFINDFMYRKFSIYGIAVAILVFVSLGYSSTIGGKKDGSIV